ncbi:MAG: RNA polymerase subunit sigma-70 [Acidobacteria bacterium]|nr:RNA polymerase subunit sigma-70 [Acidobacteriota bacterium]
MDITALLRRIHAGDHDALNAAVPFVYDELKRLASSHVRRLGKDVPMQATTLVHEAYLRMVHSKHPDYGSRVHFYCIASRVMRQVLVDAARAQLAQKRGGEAAIPLGDLSEFGAEPNERLLAVDAAIERLTVISETKASLIEMRYFGGMTAEDCAEAMSMSVHMVRKELRFAQAWLRSELAV